MPYQQPKKLHPWRQYKDRPLDKTKKEEASKYKPVHQFLGEIVESWERVEITTYAWGKEGRFKLTELPQKKIAAWLANLLKKYYG